MIKLRWYYPALLGLLLLLPELLRPLWFDEALTVQNFVLPGGFLDTYRNYAIPNNQLLYSLLLKAYVLVVQWLPLPFDWVLRAFSLFGAVALLLFFGYRFRAWPGSGAAALALACSLPFALFGVALRGYLWSALFVLLALAGGLDYARTGRGRDWLCYALGCLLALATIPTNLLALAGVGCFLLPLLLRSRLRLAVAAATPFLMLLLFYLPIWSDFCRIAGWREGWNDRSAALLAVYGGFAAAFPLLTLALPGIVRRGLNRRRLLPALALLLPLPVVLLLQVAPFPRVFFPLFPLWLLLAGGAAAALAARFRRHAPTLLAALAVGSALWGVFTRWDPWREQLSELAGGGAVDDYFYPYHARPEFDPQGVIARLSDPAPPAEVFCSFRSDPWSLMFYGRLHGWESAWMFDGPRGPVAELTPDAVVILRPDEAPETVTGRFGGTLIPLGRNAFHQWFRYRR